MSPFFPRKRSPALTQGPPSPPPLFHTPTRLRFPLSRHFCRLLLTFRTRHCCLLLAFSAGDRSLSIAFRLQYERATIALRGHLFLHRDAHVFRRVDVLHVDARHLHAPLVGSFVKNDPQLGVDLIAL